MNSRIKLKEITFERFKSGIMKRILYIKYAFHWRLSSLARQHQADWKKLKNKYENQICFLIANGPSLNKIDISKLKKFTTFGLNRIYLLQKKNDFLPTYLVSVNDLVLNQYWEDIKQLNCRKFISWKFRDKFSDDKNVVFFLEKNSLKDKFSVDCGEYIYSGGTVTFIALQIIFHMGFKKVYIIGLDHNFIEKGIPNKTEIRSSEEDKNHFVPNYFPKGSFWQLPDLVRSEIVFSLANDIYKKNNREIIDLTIDGKCKVFTKKKFDDEIEFLNKNL